MPANGERQADVSPTSVTTYWTVPKTKEYKKNCKKNKSSSFFLPILGFKQYVFLPKAELKTKNETKRPLLN